MAADQLRAEGGEALLERHGVGGAQRAGQHVVAVLGADLALEAGQGLGVLGGQLQASLGAVLHDVGPEGVVLEGHGELRSSVERGRGVLVRRDAGDGQVRRRRGTR